MNRKEALANKLKELKLTPTIIAAMMGMPERAINDIFERGTTRAAYLISLWAMDIPPWLLLPVTREAKKNTQSDLARKIGLSSRQVLGNYLTCEGSGAQIRFALALSEETRSDVKIWLRGGSLKERREAVQRWEDNL